MSRRNAAEQMFNDMIDTLKEKQDELDRAVAEYTSKSQSKPTMDVMEDEETITVITDLPGVNKEDIKIDLTEDALKITAKFQEEIVAEDVNFYRRERKYGEAKRNVKLPAQIKMDETSAKFENGVLTVVLPKVEKETFEVKLD
jgi:HSP20 family protein